MTLATTDARVRTVLESVDGVGQVHDRIRTETDRGLAETYILDDSGRVNVWEYEVDTETYPDGASGTYRVEPLVSIVAHYFDDDEVNSRKTFRNTIDAVQRALMDVSSGFVQIKEDGVQLIERPTLVRLRTDHTALRARIEFRLWDYDPT